MAYEGDRLEKNIRTALRYHTKYPDSEVSVRTLRHYFRKFIERLNGLDDDSKTYILAKMLPQDELDG